MKKLIALFLAAGLMAATMTGCADSTVSVPDDSSAVLSDDSSMFRARPDLKDQTIGISVSSLRGNFMKLFRSSLMNRLKRLGFSDANISIYENNGDKELELKMIDLLVESKVDQILVCPNDTADISLITDKAAGAGIPLIYFNYIPDEKERERWKKNNWNVSCIGPDRAQVGQLQAVLVSSIGMEKLDMNKNGMVDYVLLEGSEESPLPAIRKEAFLEEMEKSGTPIQCLMDCYANWNRDEAHSAMEDALLGEGNNVEVVICQSDNMALGAMLAIQEAGRIVSSDIYLLGVDCEKEALQNIRQGTMTGSVFVDGRMQAADAVTNIMNNIDGFRNEPVTYTEYALVTAANAGNVEDILSHLS